MEKEKSNAIVGRNGVRELLRSGRDIDKIFISREAGKGPLSEICTEARKRGLTVVYAPDRKLDELAGGVRHQGVVAMPSEAEYSAVEDIFALAQSRGEKPFIVICDEISDPHNLGAIIRCAEGTGAHGVIIPKRRSSGITQVVSKASAGALSHIPVVREVNLARAVDKLKEMGVWVFAAEAGGSSYYECDFDCPCAVILGSEGEGVSRLLKDKSDFIVEIPMYGKVTSFNVSTAGAVIFCEVAKQRHGRK